MDITSAKNPRVKRVVKLRQARHRRAAGRMIVEGDRCLGRALDAGIPVEEIFCTPAMRTDAAHAAVIDRAFGSGAEVLTVPDFVLAKLAYRDTPEGPLAVAVAPARPLDALVQPAGGLYLLAEAIEKPGNLGAMLRIVDAVGAAGMILCDPHTDIYNPNVIRASTGAVFSVPIGRASVDAAVAWLTAGGVRIVAATPTGQTAYHQADLTGPVAIVVGSEHRGLSDGLLGRADVQVAIPMAGVADSLNVSVAATVLLFEAARQRGFGVP